MPLPTLIFLIILAVLIVYLAVWLFCIRPRTGLDASNMESLKKYDYAHRGFYEKDQSIPENSLPAFQRAVSKGFGVELDLQLGPVLYVAGADLLDQTPIYDIKPYLTYTDSHPEAVCGFADRVKDYELTVEFPQNLLNLLPEEKREAAVGILRQDPRPSYHNDPKRRYGVAFAGYDIRFHVKDGVLTVCQVVLPGEER